MVVLVLGRGEDGEESGVLFMATGKNWRFFVQFLIALAMLDAVVKLCAIHDDSATRI